MLKKGEWRGRERVKREGWGRREGEGERERERVERITLCVRKREGRTGEGDREREGGIELGERGSKGGGRRVFKCTVDF